jgi:hypothetical protein
MTAQMAARGPISRAGTTVAATLATRQAEFDRLPRGWDGFRVDAASGLTSLEIAALARAGHLAAPITKGGTPA